MLFSRLFKHLQKIRAFSKLAKKNIKTITTKRGLFQGYTLSFDFLFVLRFKELVYSEESTILYFIRCEMWTKGQEYPYDINSNKPRLLHFTRLNTQ